jgi:hypothetical protein
LTAIIAVTASLVVWISQQRNHVKRLNLHGRFLQLELALKSYHADYGAFPPPRYQSASAEYARSWRVLLLPYLHLDEVYDRYRFDEPWNSLHNSNLADSLREAPAFFRSPFSREAQSMSTDFVAVDPSRAPPREAHLFTVVADDSQFCLAEMANSRIHWMDPRNE